jgi:ubiquinone/menaquinone biosynthesis C-methylase UbiE
MHECLRAHRLGVLFGGASSLFLRTMLRHSLLIVLALLLLGAVPCPAQPDPAPVGPPVYKGRRVANVMSYAGAPWLERASRDEEEAPAKLIAKLAFRPGQNVADVGCGSGFYSRRIAPLVGPTGKVYGADIQPEMLRMLEESARKESIANIVPILAEPDDPKLPAGAIDWILLVDVYHELQDPDPVLAKMREALAPEGRVALVEFRLEGSSAAHIRTEHRMSVEQVLAEWEPAGFELIELWEEMPTQHVFVFKKSDAAAAKP